MKRLLPILLFLLTGLSWGQYTAVTATVVDPNGFPYQFCKVTATFVNMSNLSVQPTIYGSPFQTGASAGCDGFGKFNMSKLVDNLLVAPQPSMWAFTICDFTGKYCFSSTQTVTGVVSNLSNQISADAPALPSNLVQFSSIQGKPNTLVGYGITDGVSTSQAYVNPNWITSIAWNKLTGIPPIPQSQVCGAGKVFNAYDGTAGLFNCVLGGSGGGGGSGITSLNGAQQAAQTFVGGANINVATDTNFGKHTFSVTGLSNVATSGKFTDLLNIPSAFPPTLPNSTTPGGVFMPANCPDQTLSGVLVHSHVSGVNFATGQLACTPDWYTTLALQVNGTTIASNVNVINFVASSGLQLTGAVNAQTGVLTFTITGSTATQAQTPVFSPLPGAYTGSQNISMTCASPSPSIFYTTDGSTPTHGSTGYSTPVAITTGTLKAICASSGLADSNVQTGVYTQTAPAVSLDQTNIAFGNQAVGTTSSPIAITLQNTGTATLTISSITFTGTNPTEFSQTNTCGGSVAAGANCAINVSFTPATTGNRTANVSIADNAAGSPHTVSLAGSGQTPTGSVSPPALTFPTTNVGASSASQALTITNTGLVSMVVSSVNFTGANTGDFSQTNNCTQLPSNTSCTVNVIFTPTAAGSRSATVNVISNASNSPQSAAVSGNAQGALVSVAPSSLSFGSVVVSNVSGGQNVAVQNVGTATMGISSVSAGGTNPGDFGFSLNPASCNTIAPSATCNITVNFTPQATGARSGLLIINDNAPGSPHTVALTGTGVQPTAVVAPTSLNFGSQIINTSGAAQAVTLTNNSNFPMTLNAISVSSNYVQSNNCNLTIPANTSCTINVTFHPGAVGVLNGTLQVTDNASNSPQTTTLTGTGINPQPVASLTPASQGFGSVCPGDSSVRLFTLSNTGTGTLSISSIGITNDVNGVFAVSTTTCGTSLLPNSSCTINVEGTGPPAASGKTKTATGTLAVTDNASGSPHTAALTVTSFTSSNCL